MLRYLEAILKNSRPTYDVINMAERPPAEKDRFDEGRVDKERRRSPRFNCGGFVEINWLPSNGIYVPGKVRDLSLQGCCIDTKEPLDPGKRAEIVVRVKTDSFRAVGEVRVIRGDSGAGIEFVRLSAGGKNLLEDLLAELARIQAAIDKLKAASPKMDPDSFRKELNYRRLQAEMLSTRFPFLATVVPEGKSTDASADSSPVPGKKPLVIPIDLFG